MTRLTEAELAGFLKKPGITLLEGHTGKLADVPPRFRHIMRDHITPGNYLINEQTREAIHFEVTDPSPGPTTRLERLEARVNQLEEISRALYDLLYSTQNLKPADNEGMRFDEPEQ
jgi:hypothetical protein